jgi:hypothetical protein
MIAKTINESLRSLFFDGGQLDLGADADACEERQPKPFGYGLEILKEWECPCGCGLKGDACKHHQDHIRKINDEIPF